MRIVLLVAVLTLMNSCSKNNLPIQGTWRSEEDEKYMVRFARHKFYEIYGTDTTVYRYTRSSKSCDLNYLKERNRHLDFIRIDDGRCFEIVGITDSSLAYRHTVSGKMQLFQRPLPDSL